MLSSWKAVFHKAIAYSFGQFYETVGFSLKTNSDSQASKVLKNKTIFSPNQANDLLKFYK